MTNTNNDQNPNPNPNTNTTINDNDNENDNENENENGNVTGNENNNENEKIDQLLEILKDNRINSLREWLRKGGDVNKPIGPENWTVVHYALYYRSKTRVISLLLNSGADLDLVDRNEMSYLHFALYKRNSSEVIKLLVSKGLNINKRNTKGQTPLMFASFTKQKPEIVQLLLDEGADPNFVDNFNWNALTYAIVMLARPKIIFNLLASDVDVNIVTKKKHRSALHYACKIRLSEEIIRGLIDAGSNIELRTKKNGMTPLMYLARDAIPEDLPKIELFLTYAHDGAGCNVFALNKKGLTAIDLARDPEIRKRLRTHASLQYDFFKLFVRSELTDLHLSEIKFHRSWFEFRSGIKYTKKVKKILEKCPKQILTAFLVWVYSAIPSPNIDMKEVEQIAQKCGITDFKKKSNLKTFKKQLLDLYKDTESKKFSVTIGEKSKKHVLVHKIILQARSDLYRGMFINVINDNSQQVSDYSGRSLSSIRQLFRFLYTNDLRINKIDSKIIKELQDAPEFYQLNTYSYLYKYLKK
ncbi:molting protein mlt-4 [Anaeramoeba flamelloides]|uniref:Molting protein mlt-4 n=1 Tax=Anaeramoeba flamelloides TaxID=1746091 RepID=A0ABQ8Y228_9EUKA|nr:molting protein mlt-4 [Anaeramoeba flamelloides]